MSEAVAYVRNDCYHTRWHCQNESRDSVHKTLKILSAEQTINIRIWLAVLCKEDTEFFVCVCNPESASMKLTDMSNLLPKLAQLKCARLAVLKGGYIAIFLLQIFLPQRLLFICLPRNVPIRQENVKLWEFPALPEKSGMQCYSYWYSHYLWNGRPSIYFRVHVARETINVCPFPD